jgi:hypothetical protein
MKRPMMWTWGGSTLAFAALCIVAVADGSKHVDVSVAEGAHFHGTVEVDCSNSPGPFVTISGVLGLEGIDVKAIFRNNVKGTHEYEDVLTVTSDLLPDGHTITIPKQPPLGGAGGNPFVWVQLLDGSNQPLGDEIFLGRCVQGLNSFDLDSSFFLDGDIEGDFAIECTNHPGPYITFSGGFVINGLKAKFIFRNNDNPVGGPHKAESVVTLTLIGNGTTITIPKQPPLGGAGGNPLIYVQFLDADGNAISDEIELGRCVQTKGGGGKKK